MVNPSNGNSYYLLDTDTWTASQAEAVTLGGNLVTINDLAENTWVFDTFASASGVGSGGVDRYLWIGFNDIATENDHVWASGEVSAFINWNSGSGEPNDGDFDTGEDYVAMISPNPGASVLAPGEWLDVNNAGASLAPIYGVVEVAAIPEPQLVAIWTLAATAFACRRRRR